MKKMSDITSKITGELRKTLSEISNNDCDILSGLILNSDKIFVAGAGRSGFMVKAFCMRLMHMGFNAYVVGETVTPNLTDKDMLLIASGSGSTGSLVVIAEKAKDIGAKLALVTIDNQSPIAKKADAVLVIPAPSPKIQKVVEFTSVQPMGSLFEQSLLLTLDSIILLIMEKKGQTSDHMFTRHTNLE